MTVKAEDRPSGSAGDSASVSTPLFRISVELSLRGVCLSRRSEATPLSYQRQAHATVAKVHKQLQIKLRAQENGTYIIFEIADKLLKLKCAYAIIILSNNLDGV